MPLAARASAVPSYKVGLPHVTDDVRRAGLLAQLSDGHRRAKVVWVVGLPGAGKTSLVARWIAESNVRAMGYRLDADDADGAAWVDAVGESCSPEGEALPVWSPENQADLAEFARPFFATLARRELTLVIDDGHRVGDDSPIFAMLAELHEVAGDALRVIVVSRRAPPPVLARGSVAGWLALVDDLRLTADEAAAVACASAGGALGPEELAALDEADGWLAHVLVLSRQRRAGHSFRGDLRRASVTSSRPSSWPPCRATTARGCAASPSCPRFPTTATTMARAGWRPR